MSTTENGRCYLGFRIVLPDEMVCLPDTCMICKDGKWEETHRIWIL